MIWDVGMVEMYVQQELVSCWGIAPWNEMRKTPEVSRGPRDYCSQQLGDARLHGLMPEHQHARA